MVPSGAATCREHLLMLVFGEEMYKSLVAPPSIGSTGVCFALYTLDIRHRELESSYPQLSTQRHRQHHEGHHLGLNQEQP
jgi:hypothetical protein